MSEFLVLHRLFSYQLPKRDPVPVRSDDTELANSPRLVRDRRQDLRPAIDQFLIDLIDIRDKRMRVPGMIAGFLGGHLVGALAEHDLEIAERQKLPAGRRKVAFETQLFDVVFGFDPQVLNRKHVSRMDYFSIRLHVV